MHSVDEVKGTQIGAGLSGKPLIWWSVATLIVLVLFYAGVRARSNHEELTRGKINAGSDAFRKGDFAGAVKIYEEAAGIDPSNPKVHESLGRAYEAVNELPKAAGAYEKSLSLSAEQPAVLYRLAVLDRDLGRHKKAIALLKRAIALNKDDVSPRLLLASIYKHLEKYTAAIGQYDYVIEHLTTGVETAEVMADKGVVLWQQNRDGKAAIKEWEAALKKDPGNRKALGMLSVVKALTNKPAPRRTQAR